MRRSSHLHPTRMTLAFARLAGACAPSTRAPGPSASTHHVGTSTRGYARGVYAVKASKCNLLCTSASQRPTRSTPPTRGFSAERAATRRGRTKTFASVDDADDARRASGASSSTSDESFRANFIVSNVSALTRAQASVELERLDALLARHDEKYYNDADPEITDAEYDALRVRYEAIEAAHPSAASERRRRAGSNGVASARVGATPNSASGLEKIAHATPMRSLGNAFDATQVQAFMTRVNKALGIDSDDDSIRVEYCAEPKVDGASASLRYERGRLVYAASRGDGSMGEDVTRHLVGARGVPLELTGANVPEVLEIRGEVHVSEEDFERVNAERAATGARVFKNARNAAAGAMRLLDPKENQMPLRFLAYGWGSVGASDDETQTPWKTESEFLSDFLPSNGFDAVPFLGVATKLDELLQAYSALEIARPTMPYEIDGVVYKVNLVEHQNTLGADARQPRWAVAHKFTAMRATTTLRGIEVQVGRTGALTPVAVLDPVDIGGASIARATLHNFDEIARKRLKIGARVDVERAGDVIPRVVSLAGDDLAEASTYDDDAKPLPEWTPPKKCPDCGSLVVRAPLSASKNAVGSIVRCTGGLKCPSQVLERLLHFCSRDALDIRGLARGTLETLHKEGVVKSPADIFTLERRFGPESGIEEPPTWWRYAGVKNAKGEIKEGSDGLKASAVKLFQAIELRRRGVPLHRFIYALGIPNIGAHTARVLASRYETLAALQKACVAAARGGPDSLAHGALTHVDGIGPVLAQSLVDFWSEPANVAIVDEILATGVVVFDASGGSAQPKSSVASSSSSSSTSPPPTPTPPPRLPERAKINPTALKSMKILFTGVVPDRSRDEIHEILRSAGASLTSSLSPKTTLLLVGQSAGPTKLNKARELGVPVVDASVFLDALVNGDDPLAS